MKCKQVLSFGEITADVNQVGEDLHILLYGGEKPHLGCTVLSIPRPSLEDPEVCSATSSVINVTGHKDEIICRYLAEKLCSSTGKVTVCSGGFHIDHITKEQLKEVQHGIEQLYKKIIEFL